MPDLDTADTAYTDTGRIDPARIGTDSIDFDARYTVDGYPGVAFRLKDYARTEQYEGDVVVCDDEECDHGLSEMCWAVGDTSLVYDLGFVIGVMVGDNREHTIDVTSLTKINDDDFCGGCGQVGCAADGRAA
jgi:hypothetical protein